MTAQELSEKLEVCRKVLRLPPPDPARAFECMTCHELGCDCWAARR